MLQLGQKLIDDGVWRTYNGVRVKIGRAGTTEWLREQENLERPYRKKIEKGTLSAVIKRDLYMRNLARTILLDWDGVLGEDGKPVAYTEELAFQLLSEQPEFLDFVGEVALEIDNFKNEQEKKTVKKSAKLSSGS
jgi:hypothetical protein